MSKIVIDKSELELCRTLHETDAYINKTLELIKSSCNEINRYRLSQGYYKKFKEEYVPIYNYLVRRYGSDNNVLLKYVGIGNQGYDAEIIVNGKPEEIEIAYLILGEESKERSKEIIDKGCSFRYGKPEEKLNEYKELISITATKKSRKFYCDTTLVLYFPCDDMYPGDYLLPEKEFENIISGLKQMPYNTNRVDFFIPEKQVIDYRGERVLPSEIYKIK